jgi:alkaline phosphatase D
MFRRNAFGQFAVDDFLTEAGTPSRRRFLTGLAASGLLLTGGGVIDQRVWANPVFAAYPFGLGIASGDPAADGFVIWTKLAPLPLARNGGMPMKAVEVAYEIATEANMRSNVQRGTALARPELGHAVHVEIAGLEPNRDYFYRFSCGGERTMIGRARTLPAAGASLERVNFGVLGCQRYEDGFFSAFRHVAEERFDFVFHYGDYIYEYRMVRPNERPLAVARVMPGEPDEIYALADYRQRYAIYKMDPDLQLAHASAPWIVSFDDHEVDNNFAGLVSEEGIPPEIFALRRAAGFQAWYAAAPELVAERAVDPGLSPLPVWRSRPDRRARHPPISQRPALRRRLACGLRRCAQAGEHHARREAGGLARRGAARLEGDMERAGAAGDDHAS